MSVVRAAPEIDGDYFLRKSAVPSRLDSPTPVSTTSLMEKNGMMDRSSEKKDLFDRLAPERNYWRKKNSYYHEELEKLLRFIIPEKSKVLEIGCGTGELLSGLRMPSRYQHWFSPVTSRTFCT